MQVLRPNFEKLPTAQWTDEEAMHHLSGTFSTACRTWPGIMERYMVEIADAKPEQHKEIMRRGLRETVSERYRAHGQPAERGT